MTIPEVWSIRAEDHEADACALRAVLGADLKCSESGLGAARLIQRIAGTQEPTALRDFDPAQVGLGSKADFDAQVSMSALPPKADIRRVGCDVCFVP